MSRRHRGIRRHAAAWAVAALVAFGIGSGCGRRTIETAGIQAERDTPTALQAVREESVALGASVEGRPITMSVFGNAGPCLFIFAAIHGDEATTKEIALRVTDRLRAHPELTADRRVAVLIEANPDGVARSTRANARGVDCNRNFPAHNWRRSRPGNKYFGGDSPASEPETQAVMQAINLLQPIRALAIHSKPGAACLDPDGPALALAEFMGSQGRNTLGSMGLPHGSFGSWAGEDLRIPCITLELRRSDTGVQAWEAHRDAVLAFIAADLTLCDAPADESPPS